MILRAFWCFMKTGLVWVYRDLLAVFAHALKLDNALDQGKQGVVPAASHVVAGMNLGAALTIDDVTGFYNLAAELFTAESLTIRIPAVA